MYMYTNLSIYIDIHTDTSQIYLDRLIDRY